MTPKVTSNDDERIGAAIVGGGIGLILWFFLGGFFFTVVGGCFTGFLFAVVSKKAKVKISLSQSPLVFVGCVAFMIWFAHPGGSAQYNKGYKHGQHFGQKIGPVHRLQGLTLDEEHVKSETQSYRSSTAAAGVWFEAGGDPTDEEFWKGFQAGYRNGLGK